MALRGSLDKVIVNRVFKVVVGELETPRWFLILTADRMQSSVSHVAKAPPKRACKIMVARAAAASKYRKKMQKARETHISGEPQGVPALLYVPLYKLENF
jgi:hypothetical protein